MKALALTNLRKVYPNGVVALDGVDLVVEEGEFFGLLGPNGAGKSTAIGIVCSLVKKTSGSAEIFGYEIDRHPWQAKSLLGLVPQEFNFNGFETVLQVVLNQAGYYGVPRRAAYNRAERLLHQLDLWDKRNEQSRTLSGGMKRRLMIARALIHEPRLLILDEPTAGVDIELRRSMWDFLREINADGTTIILTTHYLEEAENLCRNIAIIDRGRIIENTNVKALLGKLNTQSFILDITPPAAASVALPGYRTVPLDDSTLEVEIQARQSLTELFGQLAAQGIEVVSMKNKANRLEELFLDMLQKNDPPAEIGRAHV